MNHEKKSLLKLLGIGQSWEKKENKTGALRDSASDAKRASTSRIDLKIKKGGMLMTSSSN